MYIYSITFVVIPSVDTQWREWFAGEVVGRLEDSKLTLCRVLDQQHQGHFTYSLQIQLDDMQEYTTIKELIDTAGEKSHAKFGENALHFTTLLKKIKF